MKVTKAAAAVSSVVVVGQLVEVVAVGQLVEAAAVVAGMLVVAASAVVC